MADATALFVFSIQNVLLLAIGSAVFGFILLCLYLAISTKRDPNLSLSENEKRFTDPSSDERCLFPSINDEPTVTLSVVVPAYKEESRLPPMMKETLEYLDTKQRKDPSFSYEVIIVDDGSPDKTSQVALKYVEQSGSDTVRLLKFDRNRGKGGAVKMGVLSARGESILMVDADGATEFKDLDRLEKALGKDATDWTVPAISIGSRAHLQDDAIANRSFFRNFLMYGFHFLVHFLCVRGIKDTQCGFKLFTRSAARRVFPSLHVERWAFDVELLFIAQNLRIPISEVPVNWEEIEGTKMIPIFSWAQMGRDLLFIRLRYMLGLWKIRESKKFK